MLLAILTVKKFLKNFFKKNYKKNQTEIRVEKVIKRKSDQLYVKWKGYDSSLNSWIDKKNILQMSEYFPKPKSVRANLKVELAYLN